MRFHSLVVMNIAEPLHITFCISKACFMYRTIFQRVFLNFLFFLLHIKPFSQIFEGEHTEGWKTFQVELVINLYRTSSGSPLSTVLDKSAGQFVPKNKND